VVGAGDPTGDPTLDAAFAATGAHFGWKYTSLISLYAKKNGLDPYLVAAVIRHESNFRADAGYDPNNSGRAVGIMQIMPSAWKGCWGDAHPVPTVAGAPDPRTDVNLNLDCGTKKLAGLIRSMPGPDSSRADRALWCYNWGSGGCHGGDSSLWNAAWFATQNSAFPPAYPAAVDSYYNQYIAYAHSIGGNPGSTSPAPTTAALAPAGGLTQAAMALTASDVDKPVRHRVWPGVVASA
jgi:soluble lytic murein transglycosylase